MYQHSPHVDLPTLSSTSPLRAVPSIQPPNSNGATPHHHRRRRILHPNGAHNQPEPNPAELRDATARAAKFTIREKLREDWEWDPAASLLHHLQDRDHEDNEAKDDDDTVSDDSNLASWRERELDSSDVSESAMPPWSQPQSELPAFKYDSPDSVGLTMVERKRKRRRILEDEMRWNEGLRTWTLRRDDWTGGRVKVIRHPYPAGLNIATNLTNNHDNDALSQSNPPRSIAVKTELVPMTTPLLPPTHPIRSNINTQTYPSIYSKVVIQGLAPTVPINLRDMTRALVVGWKEDDQWPPKSTVLPAPPPVQRRKNAETRNAEKAERERERGLSKGVGAVKRALGLGMNGQGE